METTVLGNPEEFVKDLFDSWYVPLLRYAEGLVASRPTAEELVQEAFLELYKTLRAGRSVEFPKAWTMCVVRRKSGERFSHPFALDRPHEEIHADDVTDEWVAALDAYLDYERVCSCLDMLTPREQEVLLLRLESMKYREIAKALGISVNSVNTLLARGLEKFRAALIREPAAQPARVRR